MDRHGELVSCMNKQERETLKEENQSRIAEIVADQAMRRADRESRGEFFDDDPIITKVAASPAYDPEQGIRDQEYQQRQQAGLHYSEPHQQHDQPSSSMQEALEEFADFVGEQTGATANEVIKLKAEIGDLRDEVAAMKTQMTILRSTISGEIKLIEGHRDVA